MRKKIKHSVLGYDSIGNSTQKYASGVRTKYAYAANQRYREKRGDENKIIRHF